MTEERLALIIANNQYDDPDLGQLVAPAQDAKALEKVLGNRSIGGFGVKMLLNESKSNVEQTIEAFFDERKRDDFILLYFSCHGIKDKDGQLYFATSNTKRKLLRSTAVSANFVNNAMRDSHSRQQVLILDCCYGGAFARGMVAKADKVIGINERFKGSGRVVLASSDAMEYSFEGDELKGESAGSIFTRVVVQGLETGKADIDGDEWISTDDLFEYVKSSLKGEVTQQKPEMWSFDMQRKILIARNPNPVPKTFESPPTLKGTMIDAGMVSESGWSITAYFELYGSALDLYITLGDLTSIMRSFPEELRELGLLGYRDVVQKFSIGLSQFLSAYSGYVSNDDKNIIQMHIGNLGALISKGRVYLERKEYEEVERIFVEIEVELNRLRGLSRSRILSLLTELQRGGQDLQSLMNVLKGRGE